MTNPSPRIVTSCRGRFHIFDQARELAQAGALHRLITDYPRSWPVRHGVPADRVLPLLGLGLVTHGLGRLSTRWPETSKSLVQKHLHNLFSRRLARVIPPDTDFLIGLSASSLEALEVCRERGIPCAVDHGSLHQATERDFILQEAARWGIKNPPRLPAPWVIDKENREFATADHILVLSQAAADSLVAHGTAREKIWVNPAGVDLEAFHPAPQTPDIFRVLQVGAVVLNKGVLTTLDAFSRVRGGPKELWFLGGGFAASGLAPFFDRWRVPGAHVLPPVPQSALPTYYHQASVFVLASVADGFGLVVAQAMACGLPVIVTENVGAKDLVQEGINGFIVPVGSPEMLAERLQFLCDNPDQREAMGRAARATVENGLGWADYGHRLLAPIAATCRA